MEAKRNAINKVQKRLTPKFTREGEYEYAIEREGHVATVTCDIAIPKPAEVSISVGGMIMWSAHMDAHRSVLDVPSINLLKTGLHKVSIHVHCDCVAEEICVDSTYMLFDNLDDVKRIATEGIPSIHGWQLNTMCTSEQTEATTLSAQVGM
jgi:hypothetical protein